MNLFKSAILWCTLPLWTAGCSLRPRPLEILSSWGVQASAPGEYQLVRWESAQNTPVESTAQSLQARAPGGAELRAEHLSAAQLGQAEDYLRTRVQGILRIYDTRPEPYQGTVTRRIECPARFQPVVEHTREGDDRRITLRLFAGAGGAFGACADDNIKFQARITALYCARTRAVTWIEHFASPGSPAVHAPEFHCRGDVAPTAASFFELLKFRVARFIYRI